MLKKIIIFIWFDLSWFLEPCWFLHWCHHFSTTKSHQLNELNLPYLFEWLWISSSLLFGQVLRNQLLENYSGSSQYSGYHWFHSHLPWTFAKLASIEWNLEPFWCCFSKNFLNNIWIFVSNTFVLESNFEYNVIDRITFKSLISKK